MKGAALVSLRNKRMSQSIWFGGLGAVLVGLTSILTLPSGTRAETKLSLPKITPAALKIQGTTEPGLWRFLFLDDAQGGQRPTATPAENLEVHLEVAASKGELQLRQRGGSLYRDDTSLVEGKPNLCLTAAADIAEATTDCAHKSFEISQDPKVLTLHYFNPPGRAGRYEGVIRVSVQEQEEAATSNGNGGDPEILNFTIPFTLTLKDGPWLALFVLLFGLGLGMANTWYRSGQMKLDKIATDLDHLVDLAKLRGITPEQNGCPAFWKEVWQVKWHLQLREVGNASQALTEASKALETCLAQNLGQAEAATGLSDQRTSQPSLDFAKSARLRRWIYLSVSYLVALFLLGFFGFTELYRGKPTFGAAIDYIALFLWGFGVEASRDAAMKLVSGWKLPGLDRVPA